MTELRRKYIIFEVYWFPSLFLNWVFCREMGVEWCTSDQRREMRGDKGINRLYLTCLSTIIWVHPLNANILRNGGTAILSSKNTKKHEYRIFFNNTIFRSVLGSKENWGKDIQRFPMDPPAPVYAQPPPLSPSHQSGPLITIGESTMTHHYNPQSIVYITVDCWCIFYGFGQKYNDLYLSLYYYTEKFHCLKKSLCSI